MSFHDQHRQTESIIVTRVVITYNHLAFLFKFNKVLSVFTISQRVSKVQPLSSGRLRQATTQIRCHGRKQLANILYFY